MKILKGILYNSFITSTKSKVHGYVVSFVEYVLLKCMVLLKVMQCNKVDRMSPSLSTPKRILKLHDWFIFYFYIFNICRLGLRELGRYVTQLRATE